MAGNIIINASLVFLLVSVCSHTSQDTAERSQASPDKDAAHGNRLMQPWCSRWCQCVLTHPKPRRSDLASRDKDVAHGNILMQPWCSYWCECVLTYPKPRRGDLASPDKDVARDNLFINVTLVFFPVSVCSHTAQAKAGRSSVPR